MGMQKLSTVMQQMITITETELNEFLARCYTKTYKRSQTLSIPDVVPNEVFFINQGIARIIITDINGNEHTTFFATENNFVADYSTFILKKPAIYTLQAIEETEVVVLTREAIEWGYANLTDGEKMGRLIAESYFIYHDNFILNQYARSPKERYDMINNIFPNINNRVPQHMIASYLGITPVHLSRLKKADSKKV
jgi:CRP-like cAMP-binding protein